MPHRQTMPHRWLIVNGTNRAQVLPLARGLPVGSGILILEPLARGEMRRLRQIARARRLTMRVEGRGAARVHDLRELRRARLNGTELVLLSPIFPTATHPEWPAMPRMRAAALARLGGRRLIALGGMNQRRYAVIARLGFRGWAGLSAFRT